MLGDSAIPGGGWRMVLAGWGYFWLIVNQGTVGFDPHKFKGPFLDFWSSANSLLLLIIFEPYLRAQTRASIASRLAMAGGLEVLTVATGVGVLGAFVTAWLSNL